MEILPRTLGTRPRLACEVRAEGVVAARAEDASAVLAAVSRVPLADGIVIPHLNTGEAGVTVASADVNSAANGIVAEIGGGAAGRAKLVAAVRSALEAVALKTRDVTLVVPDAAVRVLLLDFDELPAKAAEALPVVRFRLKKLLPFDAEDAAVSYQVMASSRGGMQVLAVAMPRQVLEDYEAVVREAGFEPGAVLPSTLAALAGLSEGALPLLVVNAGREGVTTAIVKGEILLLHRTVDLGAGSSVTARTVAVETVEPQSAEVGETSISAIAARLAAAGSSAPGAAMQLPVTAAETILEGSLEAPSNEVAQAVSVAAAYFEDTLETPPAVVMSAGTLGADALMELLDQAEIGAGTLAVQEMVAGHMLGAGIVTAGPGAVPAGWLAGVRGALAG
jgi:type IV pilus assembly protein PilM